MITINDFRDLLTADEEQRFRLALGDQRYPVSRMVSMDEDITQTIIDRILV